MAKTHKKQLEEFLDELYAIAWMGDVLREVDMVYYKGALKATEFAGYDWQRDKDGKHTLFRR
jgi:hypothetical protein